MKELDYQGTKWTYYSIKDMKEMYPTGTYLVLGEITNKVEEMKDMPLFDNKGNKLFVQPIGTYKKPMYKNDGYVWSKEAAGFIIVKKSNLSLIICLCITIILLLAGIFHGAKLLVSATKSDSNAISFESRIQHSNDMNESRIVVLTYRKS